MPIRSSPTPAGRCRRRRPWDTCPNTPRNRRNLSRMHSGPSLAWAKCSSPPDGKENMRVEVKVPQLPESVAEATLVAWHKKPGEAVKRDENLIDVETDKVVLELPSPGDGVLARIVKADGESVTSGDLIAVID